MDANRKSPPGDVGLHMEGQEIHHRTFQKNVRAFFELVEEVTASVTATNNAMSWGVEVSEGSLNVGAVGRSIKTQVTAAVVASVIASGLKRMEAGEGRPDHFSDKALSNAKILASFGNPKQKRSLSIYTAQGDVPLTAKSKDSIDRLLEIKLSAYGTREGMLETASEHAGVQCTLYDRLTGEGIDCIFPEEMKDRMWAAGGKRVSVRGYIHYRASGAAAKIDADDIRVLGEGKLPSAEDVRGILGE